MTNREQSDPQMYAWEAFAVITGSKRVPRGCWLLISVGAICVCSHGMVYLCSGRSGGTCA